MIAALVAFGLLAISPSEPVSPMPAKTDDEVWALVDKVRTVDAYRLYLLRFPDGLHAPAASVAICGPGGCPPIPRIVVPRTTGLVPLPPAPSIPDACSTLLNNHEFKKIESAEASEYLAATRANRLADIHAFVAKYPRSACRDRAESTIKMREARRLNYNPIGGLGPLAPARRGISIFSADDYPAKALRAEASGKVIAEYDVADDGMVESCRIIQSSGSIDLDAATCRIITRRARYDPARNAAGYPQRSTDRMTITWTLPADEPPASLPISAQP